MKKLISIIFVALLAVSFSSCHKDNYQSIWGTNPATDPEDMSLPSNLNKYLPDIEKNCQKIIDARYMEGQDLGEVKTLPGWEGYPVRLYSYQVSDDIYGVKKNAKVYMLNPDVKKLAIWVASTAWKVKHSLSTDYTDAIIKQILYQSGGQFPVLGMVYEDMDSEGQYCYLFKDGVTCYLKDDTKKIGYKTPTDDMIDFYIKLTNNDLASYTGTYARIISTTREQYYSNGGTEDVGKSDSRETRSLKWLDVVRSLYQKAWDSNFNELMIAWASQNL